MRAVLFDLDGTLTDPRVGITRCIGHALAGVGAAVPCENDLLWCIGPPLHGSFCKMLGSAVLADRALALYRERFSEVGLYENEVYDGVEEALGLLRDSGFRLFVATSKPSTYAERIVEHFGLAPFFSGIYGSSLDGALSDKGELIAHVLEQEGLDPSRTVMVGDREHDVLGAAASGVRCIGATWGYGSEEELRNAGARALCSSPMLVARAILDLSFD